MQLFKWFRNPFKRRSNGQSVEVQAIDVKRVRDPFATSPLKFYRGNILIEVNGQYIGRFPLTMQAYSKAHLRKILNEKSRLVPEGELFEVKTNPNGKGRHAK